MSLKNDLLKFTPRKEQQDVLDFVVKTKSERKNIKFFLLNMPTGVGKSNTAMMIADFYKSSIDSNAKIDIINEG